LNKSKAKGTAGETAVVNYNLAEGIPARRNPLSGALDKGDVSLLGNLITVEVKAEKKMSLSEYVREAEAESKNAGSWLGVAWHKKVGKAHPKDWYVTMSGETFMKILRKIQESAEDTVN
jgi:hypothetical protein